MDNYPAPNPTIINRLLGILNQYISKHLMILRAFG